MEAYAAPNGRPGVDLLYCSPRQSEEDVFMGNQNGRMDVEGWVLIKSNVKCINWGEQFLEPS